MTADVCFAVTYMSAVVPNISFYLHIFHQAVRPLHSTKLDFGPYKMNPPSSALDPTCANWNAQLPTCNTKGTKACGNCRLVIYCGAECQRMHWPEHKIACKSPMSKESWRPAWYREDREPMWATGQASKNWHNTFGVSKYLWGNTPAFDVLKLDQNEGLEYRESLELLFAASGDLRHIVKTIAALPEDGSRLINVTVNDRDFDVVARNTVLLLLAVSKQASDTADKPTALSETVEALIHVWYSASIPSSVLLRLKEEVKPLIEEVCNKIAKKPADCVLSKTWEFSPGRTLRLILTKTLWLQLRDFLEVPEGITIEKASQIRRSVTMAPERTDYRDRWYYKDCSPSMRLAKQRFREDGLLLPFGHPREGFDIPNPTFLYGSGGWPMDDKADPLDGWPISDVQETPWPASEDWYGKLYVHIHHVLRGFLSRLKKNRISFSLYNLDVIDLPQHLLPDSFSRIEVSNICDAGYLGIRKTLSLLSPFLQPMKQNPHATFITLFINAVFEAIKWGNSDETPNVDKITKYLPPLQLFVPLENHPDVLRIWDARNLVLDVDKYFGKYMELLDFEQLCVDLRLKVKRRNTIIDMWPTQLKLPEGHEGALAEFRSKLGSGFTNIERYVEWTRG